MNARHFLSIARAIAATTLLASAALAQSTKTKSTKTAKAPKKADTAAPKPHDTPAFWTAAAPVELTLTVNLKEIRGDRRDDSPWRSATVRLKDDTGAAARPARVKTRGISRLKICAFFPPVWIDFAGKDTKGTALAHVNRFKLVSPCRSGTDYDKFVLEEYALYRVTATATPIHHETRIVHLTVVDSASGKTEFTRWAFALEDPDELASRLGGRKVSAAGATSDDLDPRQTAVMGVLQYMIGNTDFSISAQHNAEVMLINSVFYPIVYDFDQAGAINPPYAIPDKSLGITRVTDRLYRGLCVPNDTLAAVLADFLAKRPEVEKIYRTDMAPMIGAPAVSTTLKYFADFYDDIAKPSVVKNDIASQCRGAR